LSLTKCSSRERKLKKQSGGLFFEFTLRPRGMRLKIVSIFKRKANNMGYCFVAYAETARDAVEDSIEISKFESNETIFKH